MEMKWVIQVCEVLDAEAKPTGGHVMTVQEKGAEDGHRPLCSHFHATPQSAMACPAAINNAAPFGYKGGMAPVGDLWRQVESELSGSASLSTPMSLLVALTPQNLLAMHRERVEHLAEIDRLREALARGYGNA